MECQFLFGQISNPINKQKSYPKAKYYNLNKLCVHRKKTKGLEFDVHCLSSFVNKGSTNKVFHSSGKLPNERETFNNLVSGIHTV